MNIKQIFGNSAKVKILEAFSEHEMFDLSKSELEKITKVSRVTLLKIMGELEKEKVVMKTRVIGRISFYKLNSKSPIAQMVLLLDDIIIKTNMNHNINIEKGLISNIEPVEMLTFHCF